LEVSEKKSARIEEEGENVGFVARNTLN